MAISHIDPDICPMDTLSPASPYPVRPLPFPHVIDDHFLSPSQIERVLEFWPSKEDLYEDSPGTDYWCAYLCKVSAKPCNMQEEKRAFWRTFDREIILPLVKKLYRTFERHLTIQFGDKIEIVNVLQFMLTEIATDGTEIGLHCHPHPDWLFTINIHISNDDEANNDGLGSILYALDGFDPASGIKQAELEWITSQGKVGNTQMRPHTEYAFAPGQMLSYIESRFSFHGSQVPRQITNPNGRRRVIRIHAGTSDMTETLYGVMKDEYVRAVHMPALPVSTKAIDWLKRDLKFVYPNGSELAMDAVPSESVVFQSSVNI